MLPLPDTVTITYEIDTGETDGHGNPIVETVTTTIPAQVWPIGSSDSTSDLSGLARYRMILDRRAGIPPFGWSSLSIAWGSYDGETLNKLTVDGTIDEVRMRGRVHHYELTTKAVV